MTEVKYTEFAQQAIGLADIFNEAFKAPVPGAPASYRVKLAIPDGPSTSGGKQGTQHIKLVPIGAGPTLVAGWANPAESAAEIRSWEHLKAIQGERGGPLPDEVAYRKLVIDMKRFLEGSRIAVSVIAVPRRSAEDTPARSWLPLVLGVVAGLIVAAGAAFWLLRR